MKWSKHLRIVLSVGLVALLTACGSMRTFEIETYNPSEVTFPEATRTVLVVNHAVPQPEDVGYKSEIMGEGEKVERARADSALYDACHALGEAMMRSDYFSDVLLYHDTLRTDSLYYLDQRLTFAEVERLCEETGVDAVVSLDRLIFQMDKSVIPFSSIYVMGQINVQMKGIFRAYLPGRAQPLATVMVEDSVQFVESAEVPKVLDIYLPDPEEALRLSARYLGTKVSDNFVPHWSRESRWYYTSSGARWKEASAYASNGDWEQAGERWRQLYDRAKPGAGKAKLASNLALVEEMRGDFEQALVWATRSHDLFKQTLGDEADETQLLQVYQKALSERVTANRKLNAQFGEE